MIIPPEMHRLFLLFGCEGAGGLETLADYLAQAKAPQRRVRMAEVLWSGRNGRFPAWSPGLHGTSPCSQIMGRSSSGSASPPGIWPFLRGGLGGIFPGNRPGRLCQGKMLFRIPWERDDDLDTLAGQGATCRNLPARSDTRGALCPAAPAGSGPLRRKSAEQTAAPGPCRMGKTPCISRGQARHWTENLRNHAGGSAPPGQRRTTHAQPAAI